MDYKHFFLKMILYVTTYNDNNISRANPSDVFILLYWLGYV